MTDALADRRFSRRGFLAAGGATAATAAAIWSVTRSPASTPPGAAPVTHQGGVDRPDTPPPALELLALRTATLPDRRRLRTLLAEVGEAALASAGGPGRTTQIGIGPRLIGVIDPGLPGGSPMPAFRGDDSLRVDALEADLVVVAADDDPAVARTTAYGLADTAVGFDLAWSQAGVRAPGAPGPATVNLLGFVDGLMVPRTREQLDAGVWIGHGPSAGGTVGVVRRFRLDLERFDALATAEQEAVIGRSKATGAPLSGGNRDDEVDLRAKTPTGQYLVPARSHVRAAHPSFTGSELMMRRSYSYDNGETGEGVRDRGLLFVSYQSDIRTFVRTQQRMDDVDDLLSFVTPTARASFLVLPGFDERRPLGAPLFTR